MIEVDNIVSLQEIFPDAVRHPRIWRVLQALDEQEIPFEDVRSLLIGFFWREGPYPDQIRNNMQSLLGENIKDILGVPLDKFTIRHELDRCGRDLLYEQSKFLACFKRLNANPNGHGIL